jgi:hypothetical protein
VARGGRSVAAVCARSCAKEATHTIYINPVAKNTSTVPRHNEINNDLGKKICKDLQLPQPDA